MRKLTRSLLVAFVFTVPWDIVVVPGVGAFSRVVGLLVLGAAAVTAAAEGRLRKPHLVLIIAATLTFLAALSLMWTVSYPLTFERVWSYTQLIASAWVVQEFARTREDQERLLVAFLLGEFVSVGALLDTFRQGIVVSHWTNDRYSVQGFNADDLGLSLVMGLPIAWHLMLNYRAKFSPFIRTAAVLYLGVAPLSILLTGTRGAVLSGILALSIIPLTLFRQSARTMVATVVVAVCAIVAISFFVPDATLARISSTKGELMEGGSMTGRSDIWKAGFQVFPEHPLLGVGAGAYGAAIQRIYGKVQAPHNMAIGILVDQGILGFVVFVALLVACAVTISRMPAPDWQLWTALMLPWFLGVMSLNWEVRKITWLLFGMLAGYTVVRAPGRFGISRSPQQRGQVWPSMVSASPSRRAAMSR